MRHAQNEQSIRSWKSQAFDSNAFASWPFMRRFLTRVDLGSTWAKLSITVERSDGGIVDAEIIRPRSWILRNGLCAGRMLPLNLPELEVSGLALVTAIDECPPIAGGDGS